jgi:hypothetical protein
MVDTKTLNKYKCVLAGFMSYKDEGVAGNMYDRDHVNSTEVLAAITPLEVLRFMCLKTYGTENRMQIQLVDVVQR